jgi:hypothetical protein
MVDSADLGFYGAAWRFTDFCQHLYARSVYLQLVLKSCELPGLFRSSPRLADALKLARVPLVATLATLPSISKIPFLDSSFGLASPEWSEWDEPHRRQSDEGRSENGAAGTRAT